MHIIAEALGRNLRDEINEIFRNQKRPISETETILREIQEELKDISDLDFMISKLLERGVL